MKRLLSFAVMLVFAVSCGRGEIEYSSVSAARSTSDEKININIDIAYISSGLSRSARKEINKQIMSNTLGEEYALMKPQKAVAKWIESTWNDAIEENQEEDLGYVTDITISPFEAYGNWITMKSSCYEYTGGAHGMYDTTFMVFDKSNGSIVTRDDIFKPGTSFRITRLIRTKAATGQIFDLDGNSVDNQSMEIEAVGETTNFSVGEKGITFVYNPYEILCYAAGTITISLTWDEVSDCLLNPQL